MNRGTASNYGFELKSGEIVWILLNMDLGELKMIVDGIDLGLACQDDELTSGEFFITGVFGNLGS